MSSSNIVEIVDYSERAIALFDTQGKGRTELYKTDIDEAGGKFNPVLKYGDDRAPGWIFPKTRRETAQKLADGINSGKIKPSTNSSSSHSSAATKTYQNSGSARSTTTVDQRAFLALVSRVEALEQELALMKRQKGLPSAPISSSSNSSNNGNNEVQIEDYEDEHDEEEMQAPQPRLMRKK